MLQTNRAFRLVDMLPSWPTGTESLDLTLTQQILVQFRQDNHLELLCLKSKTTRLDQVSTTYGSGWVTDQLHKTLRNRARLRRTPPLPRWYCPDPRMLS